MRWFALALVVVLAVVLCPHLAWAAGDWPAYPLGPGQATGRSFPRGPGYYFSVWKIVGAVAVYLAWVKTADWINIDAQRHRFNYVLWNPIVVGSFGLAILLFWVLPIYPLSLLLMIVAYAAPAITYVVQRNKAVEAHERVLTPAHLRSMLAAVVNKLGGKMEVESRPDYEQGPDVKLTAMGGATDVDNNVNLLRARQSPGFLAARTLLWDARDRRADAVRLDYTAQAVAVQYQIDGVWHPFPPMERAAGDVMLAVLKTLANLNANERRARLTGKFAAAIANEKYTCRFNSQGSQTGEVALIQLEGKRLGLKSLEEAGMRTKMVEQLMEVFQSREGLIVLSAPPGGGFTTFFDLALEASDRYMRNFAGVGDIAKPERDLENVPITTYDSRQGETPMTVLPKLVRTYPDVIVIRDLVDTETAQYLCEQSRQKRLIVCGARAKEAVEAPLRILAMKLPPAALAPQLLASVNMRLVRTLCDKCKEAYPPPPEVLKQLGLPPGRIEAFFRPPSPTPENEKAPLCPKCQGIGYFGRTGIFELVVFDDELRKALETAPKLDAMRLAQRRARQRTLQEEGLLLVARGVTSLPELIRVLKS